MIWRLFTFEAISAGQSWLPIFVDKVGGDLDVLHVVQPGAGHLDTRLRSLMGFGLPTFKGLRSATVVLEERGFRGALMRGSFAALTTLYFSPFVFTYHRTLEASLDHLRRIDEGYEALDLETLSAAVDSLRA